MGGGAPVDACAPRRDEPPGAPIYAVSTPGSGECKGTSLADTIEAVRQLRPDLSDVTELYAPDPERGGDGSFIYAFAKPDGGVALVFKRGDGDCPAGCTINDYWYFETGADCAVEALGEAHRDFEHCMQPDQLPRWGIPRAALPSEICGTDLSPENLNGHYSITTCGTALACAFSGEKPSERALPARIGLTIAQDAADLSRGTVTLDGTGETTLDGLAFEATFERRSFTVDSSYQNLPEDCSLTWNARLAYDFEGLKVSKLNFFFTKSDDCSVGVTCKGDVSASFGPASKN
jgi:hypothetical protein